MAMKGQDTRMTNGGCAMTARPTATTLPLVVVITTLVLCVTSASSSSILKLVDWLPAPTGLKVLSGHVTAGYTLTWDKYPKEQKTAMSFRITCTGPNTVVEDTPDTKITLATLRPGSKYRCQLQAIIGQNEASQNPIFVHFSTLVGSTGKSPSQAMTKSRPTATQMALEHGTEARKPAAKSNTQTVSSRGKAAGSTDVNRVKPALLSSRLTAVTSVSSNKAASATSKAKSGTPAVTNLKPGNATAAPKQSTAAAAAATERKPPKNAMRTSSPAKRTAVSTPPTPITMAPTRPAVTRRPTTSSPPIPPTMQAASRLPLTLANGKPISTSAMARKPPATTISHGASPSTSPGHVQSALAKLTSSLPPWMGDRPREPIQIQQRVNRPTFVLRLPSHTLVILAAGISFSCLLALVLHSCKQLATSVHTPAHLKVKVSLEELPTVNEADLEDPELMMAMHSPRTASMSSTVATGTSWGTVSRHNTNHMLLFS
ncbi:mucin-5AC-like [Sycon ciliatum]|uniref:mucin-5AC-like n=1 Tax=Sycon ciliatum TaxID=27933 RepID=UPI0031F70150